MSLLASHRTAASFAFAFAFVLGGSAGCGYDGAATADVPARIVAMAEGGPFDGGAPEAAAPAQAQAQPFCDPADISLIVCFRFDDSIVDESSHAQPVTVGGTPAFVPGVSGDAVSMTASTTLHVPDGPAWTTSSLTVEMWIRPRSLPLSGQRAGLLDKDGSFGMFLQPNGDITCTFGASIRATGAAARNRWTHVACTNDSGKLEIYVDGRRVDEVDAAAINPTTGLAAFGGNSPSGDAFDGDLDDVRVFSRARTAAEISAAAVK